MIQHQTNKLNQIELLSKVIIIIIIIGASISINNFFFYFKILNLNEVVFTAEQHI